MEVTGLSPRHSLHTHNIYRTVFKTNQIYRKCKILSDDDVLISNLEMTLLWLAWLSLTCYLESNFRVCWLSRRHVTCVVTRHSSKPHGRLLMRRPSLADNLSGGLGEQRGRTMLSLSLPPGATWREGSLWRCSTLSAGGTNTSDAKYQGGFLTFLRVVKCWQVRL